MAHAPVGHGAGEETSRAGSREARTSASSSTARLARSRSVHSSSATLTRIRSSRSDSRSASTGLPPPLLPRDRVALQLRLREGAAAGVLQEGVAGAVEVVLLAGVLALGERLRDGEDLPAAAVRLPRGG